MSAPNTNLEKQKRRHWPVLIGFVVVALFAGLVFMLNVGVAVDGEGPVVEEMTDDSAPVMENEVSQ